MILSATMKGVSAVPNLSSARIRRIDAFYARQRSAEMHLDQLAKVINADEGYRSRTKTTAIERRAFCAAGTRRIMRSVNATHSEDYPAVHSPLA